MEGVKPADCGNGNSRKGEGGKSQSFYQGCGSGSGRIRNVLPGSGSGQPCSFYYTEKYQTQDFSLALPNPNSRFQM